MAIETTARGWDGWEGEIPEYISIEVAKREIRDSIDRVRVLASDVDERIDWDYAPEDSSPRGGEVIPSEEYQRHEFGHVLRNLRDVEMHLDDIGGC